MIVKRIRSACNTRKHNLPHFLEQDSGILRAWSRYKYNIFIANTPIQKLQVQ